MVKQFFWAFISAFTAITLGVLGLTLWLEPYTGDLTRISGATENAFGWNQPQTKFSKNYSQFAVMNHPAPEGQYDIIVFGDSFSHTGMDAKQGYGWQNFIGAHTGLSIYTYHRNHTDFFQWLNATPQERLPKYIIYQLVERSLANLAKDAPNCDARQEIFDPIPQPIMLLPAAPLSLERQSLATTSIADAMHRIKMLAKGRKKARILPLTTNGLFSSRNQYETLVLQKDSILDNQPPTNATADAVVCFFTHLHNAVAALPNTQLVIAIAPDKATAYSDYLNVEQQPQTLFDLIGGKYSPLFRYDLYFQNQIQQGAVDLYLPNDSHWGSEGNRHFASIIYAQMQK